LWALRIWVFVVEVTDKFILGLDVLWIYNASVAICYDWIRRR